MKRTYRGRRAPKGYHFMPGGKLMKDSAHGRKKKAKSSTKKKKGKASKRKR